MAAQGKGPLVVLAPAELPIGVVTAFLGAPFLILVLRTSERRPS